MSADADHWWRNRRGASANSGDAWSGGGKAYQKWMGAKPEPEPPAPSSAAEDAASGDATRVAAPRPASAPTPVIAERSAAPRVAEWEGSLAPRAPHLVRARAPRSGGRALRSGAETSLLLVAGAPLRWLKGRRRFRGPLGWIATGSVAVVLLTPLAWAGRTDPCAAAEVALIDRALGRDNRFEHMRRRAAAWTWPDGGLFARGQVGRQIAFEEHPVLPSLAGCTALFWRARIAAATTGGFTAASSTRFIILR